MPDTNYIATSAELTETADAIREKTGDSSPIEWEEGTGFANAIADIPSGGSPVEGLTNALEFRNASSFTLTANKYSGANWNGTVEWTDGIQPWAAWDGSTLTASDGVLYLRGTNNTHFATSEASYIRFYLIGQAISCRGNIETLLDYATVANGQHPVMDDYCFNRLFYNCTTLVAAPALPATALRYRCYKNMFYGCSRLTSAPALPATTLAYGCYNSMFSGCKGLTSAPALPATTLADYCYQAMFWQCTALTTAPAFPATTLPSGCYEKMFYGCTSLKLSASYDSGSYPYTFRIPKSGTGTIVYGALDNMFLSTGGTFTGTPSINTDYYTENPPVEATP